MSDQQSRTGGHGFTFLKWRGTLIANVQQIAHVSPQPVAPPSVIHPLNMVRPLEIATPGAIGHGVLTVQLIELWDTSIWHQFADFAGSTDLADIFAAQAKVNDDIQVFKAIVAPGRHVTRTITYHGCKIADVRDGETIDVTTIQVNKEIDIWYTKAFDGRNSSTPFGDGAGVINADGTLK